MSTSCPCRLVLALLLLATVFGAPYGLLAVAEARLSEAPCATGEPGVAAPETTFFEGHRVADWAAMFPWTHHRAVALSTDATRACMDAFASGCGVLRDTAILETQDRLAATLGTSTDPGSAHLDLHQVDWRDQVDDRMQASFCDDWSAWIDWVETHDLDAGQACGVCGDAS